MPLDLSGKVGLVTGGGRGIGRSICLSLAKAGASVVAAARTLHEVEETVRLIEDQGGTGAALRTDIADEDQVHAVFSQIREQFGRLDIMVNNAGIGRYGPVADFDSDDFDRIISVNLRGTFLCCREAMRLMIPGARGYIINIASVVGFKGYVNQAAYAASKHGVMGLTKTLAVEAQEHNIRVSAILPGGVDTDMVREARPDLDPDILLQPEDVAQTVEYLLSLSDRAAVDQIYIRRASGTPF